MKYIINKQLILESTSNSKIFNIPLSFLFTINNPETKAEFELQSKKEVDYNEFKNDIKTNGILEPLVILINKDWIRLETGNHRIFALRDIGESTAPCIIKPGEKKDANLGNGKHFYKRMKG